MEEAGGRGRPHHGKCRDPRKRKPQRVLRSLLLWYDAQVPFPFDIGCLDRLEIVDSLLAQVAHQLDFGEVLAAHIASQQPARCAPPGTSGAKTVIQSSGRKFISAMLPCRAHPPRPKLSRPMRPSMHRNETLATDGHRFTDIDGIHVGRRSAYPGQCHRALPETALSFLRPAENAAQQAADDFSAKLASDGAGGLLGHGLDHALAALGAPEQIVQCPAPL